jgi:hypothetical protein
VAAGRTIELGSYTHCTLIGIDGVEAETQTTVTVQPLCSISRYLNENIEFKTEYLTGTSQINFDSHRFANHLRELIVTLYSLPMLITYSSRKQFSGKKITKFYLIPINMIGSRCFCQIIKLQGNMFLARFSRLQAMSLHQYKLQLHFNLCVAVPGIIT